VDNLDLIYIRKVFSLFIYVTPERRYCDVKSDLQKNAPTVKMDV